MCPKKVWPNWGVVKSGEQLNVVWGAVGTWLVKAPRQHGGLCLSGSEIPNFHVLIVLVTLFSQGASSSFCWDFCLIWMVLAFFRGWVSSPSATFFFKQWWGNGATHVKVESTAEAPVVRNGLEETPKLKEADCGVSWGRCAWTVVTVRRKLTLSTNTLTVLGVESEVSRFLSIYS